MLAPGAGVKKSDHRLFSFMLPQLRVETGMTLSAFFDEKYVPYATKRKSSIKHDLSTFNNHLRYSLGRRELDSLNPELIENWKYDQRGRNYRVSTVNKHVFLLNRLIFLAKDWGYINRNMSDIRSTDKLPEGDFKQYFLSAPEIERLMAAARASANPYLPHFVELMLLTGARHGEALGANWSDINLPMGIWIVPKSKSGRTRKIVLNERAKLVFSNIRRISRSVPARAENRDAVFLNPKTKKPYKSLHVPWDEARREAGLDSVRIHDLRHTFASILINAGASLYEVQTLLGHSTPQMTQRYAHLSENTLHRRSELVSDFLSGLG